IDNGLVSNRHADRGLRQGHSGVEGVTPATDYRAPRSFKFKFDPFEAAVGAGQTTFRPQHAYGKWTDGLEWTQPLTGQINVRVDGDPLRLPGSYACAVQSTSLRI